MQLTASIAASAWLLVVFPNPALPDGRSATQIAIVSLPPNTSISSAFFMEFSLSAILAYVIFATAFETVDTTNNVRVGTQQPEMEIDRSVGRNLTIYTTTADSKAGFAPLAIGLCLGFLCCVGGSVSGGAFNPARVFGPAFVTGVWDGHWREFGSNCLWWNRLAWLIVSFVNLLLEPWRLGSLSFWDFSSLLGCRSLGCCRCGGLPTTRLFPQDHSNFWSSFKRV